MLIPLALLRRCCPLFAFLLLSLLAVAPAVADPAGRIGRIAWLSGSVHLHRADSGESSSALLNWPISSGDVLSTGSGARSEVQIGSTSVQLDSASVLEFVEVDDQRIRLRLLDGSVIVRLRSAEAAGEFELGTRDGGFSIREAGRYRFDVDRSTVTASVHAGSAHFANGGSALEIGAGQRVQMSNDGRTRYQLAAPLADDFDRWSSARERQASSAVHARYVSPEMTGAADLDAYGNWSESAEYGAIWFPRTLAADWAPYRSGRWVWVAPWGWTWVGDEPWGFAPFHYGRWVLYGGAWGWVPGRRVARPVYAPALVAWVGTPGSGVSVGIGARPAVGWFPLAPREVYVPPYRASANYIRQVNVTHVTQINNITTITGNPQAAVERMPYAHRQVPRAVTMVAADVVTQQRPISRQAALSRDAKPFGTQSVQVQAPVAPPPIDARRRPEANAPLEPGRRERESGRAAADFPFGGRVERPPQIPPVGVAPSGGAASLPASGQPSAATPSPSPSIAAGETAERRRQFERGQPGRDASWPPPGGQAGDRVGSRQAPPAPGASAPPGVRSSPPPTVPSATQTPPATAISAPAAVPAPAVASPTPPPAAANNVAAGLDRPLPATGGRGADPREIRSGGAAGMSVPPVPRQAEQTSAAPAAVPRSPSAVGAVDADRAGAAGGRPWPSRERPEQRAATPTAPSQLPFSAPPPAERAAAATDRSAGGAAGRPEQRITTPVPPVATSPSSPPASPAVSRFPERPAAVAPNPAMPPAMERFDPRVEQRQEAFARQRRNEKPVEMPSAMPQRPAAAPGGVDSSTPNERQPRPEGRSDGGRQRERRGDGRPDFSQRAPDG